MRISPVNNISFGKLVLLQNNKTKEVMSNVIRDKATLQEVKDAFEKLDEVTGERRVELSAREEAYRHEKPRYIFCLNNGNPDWTGVSCSMKTDGSEKITEILAKLTDACKERIERLNKKIRQTDIDKLFEDYKSQS